VSREKKKEGGGEWYPNPAHLTLTVKRLGDEGGKKKLIKLKRHTHKLGGMKRMELRGEKKRNRKEREGELLASKNSGWYF